jgi:hypothetical protein
MLAKISAHCAYQWSYLYDVPVRISSACYELGRRNCPASAAFREASHDARPPDRRPASCDLARSGQLYALHGERSRQRDERIHRPLVARACGRGPADGVAQPIAHPDAAADPAANARADAAADARADPGSNAAANAAADTGSDARADTSSNGATNARAHTA